MPNSRPNIILCTCDQLRAFEVGCYGNAHIQTPHLDRLASEGLRVENAITNAPVCMAARSVMLSGQYNRRCTGGIGNVSYPGREGDYSMPEYPYDGRLHLRDPALPELLRGQGYHTQAMGKWHIHSWPNDIGFDQWLIPRVHHCHTGQSYTENGGREFVPEGYSVDFEADRMEAFLADRAESDDPFFLYYNISPPHCPVDDAPEKYTKMYDPEKVPLRENVDLNKPLPNQDYHFKVWLHDFRYYAHRLPYTEELPEGFTLKNLYALYYGMVTWVDDVVGRMTAALEANGLTDNTLLVFVSDHGEVLGSHSLSNQKGSAHEESLRIPMIARYPGHIPAGSVMEKGVGSLVDLAPSFLDLAGIPIPEHMHGTSLREAWERPHEVAGPEGAIFEGFIPMSFGIRAQDYTYVLPRNKRAIGEKPVQIFDHQKDPFQFQNLVETGGAPQDRMAELDAQLRAWDQATPWLQGVES